MSKQMKAVFFDRDGTLNVDKSYLYKIEELEWMPEALEALAYLAGKGYLLFVVTNQSGIARGYYTLEQLQLLHGYMAATAAAAGAAIEKFYYCPHLQEGCVPKYSISCTCRKPQPGMLLQCFREYDIDKAASFMIGDGQRDVECAQNAGIRGYLYSGGSLLEFVKKLVP